MPPYTNISASRVDADSPVDEEFGGDAADNDQHLFEHALRCGTYATGVRLALARGATDLDINLDGSGNGQSSDAITFTTALDGNPAFSVAPTCIGLVFEELSTGGDVGTPTSLMVRIEEGSLSTSGFTVVTTVRGGGATVTVDFRIHWAFVGAPSSGE